MKKLLLITCVVIAVPTLIISVSLKNNKEINYNLITKSTIRVKRNSKNKIEILPFEEYLVGVVAGEMPVSFHEEALKALAVAARNYAYKKKRANKDKEYDVIDTTANQVYLDIETLKKSWGNEYIKNINKVRKSVHSTINEYILYKDQIIDVFYFSTSNGYTENVVNVFKIEVPYLVSVESPWDKIESSTFLTTRSFDYNDFCKKLEVEAKLMLDVKNIKRSISNRIISLEINGKLIDSLDMYKKFGLRSTDFEIKQEKDKVIITTKGFGHGVGMSQYGANGMAKEGYTYKEILTHYYKGTEVKEYRGKYES